MNKPSSYSPHDQKVFNDPKDILLNQQLENDDLFSSKAESIPKVEVQSTKIIKIKQEISIKAKKDDCDDNAINKKDSTYQSNPISTFKLSLATERIPESKNGNLNANNIQVDMISPNYTSGIQVDSQKIEQSSIPLAQILVNEPLHEENSVRSEQFNPNISALKSEFIAPSSSNNNHEVDKLIYNKPNQINDNEVLFINRNDLKQEDTNKKQEGINIDQISLQKPQPIPGIPIDFPQRNYDLLNSMDANIIEPLSPEKPREPAPAPPIDKSSADKLQNEISNEGLDAKKSTSASVQRILNPNSTVRTETISYNAGNNAKLINYGDQTVAKKQKLYYFNPEYNSATASILNTQPFLQGESDDYAPEIRYRYSHSFKEGNIMHDLSKISKKSIRLLELQPPKQFRFDTHYYPQKFKFIKHGEIWVQENFLLPEICKEIIELSEAKNLYHNHIAIPGVRIADFCDSYLNNQFCSISKTLLPLACEGAIFDHIGTVYTLWNFNLPNATVPAFFDSQPYGFQSRMVQSKFTLKVFLNDVLGGGEIFYSKYFLTDNLKKQKQFEVLAQEGRLLVYRQANWLHHPNQNFVIGKYILWANAFYRYLENDSSRLASITELLDAGQCELCKKSPIITKTKCCLMPYVICGCPPFNCLNFVQPRCYHCSAKLNLIDFELKNNFNIRIGQMDIDDECKVFNKCQIRDQQQQIEKIHKSFVILNV